MITFYVNKNSIFLKHGKFSGMNYGFITFISRELSDINKQAIYIHEYTHYKQWKRKPFTHLIRYELSKKYRYECELEAYKNQCTVVNKPYVYAKFMKERYNMSELVNIDDVVKQINIIDNKNNT